MEITKTIIEQREVIESVTCDRCGCKIENDRHEVFQSRFRWKTGHSYPDGGWAEMETADFCKECNESVIQLMKSNGIKFNYSDEWYG